MDERQNKKADARQTVFALRNRVQHYAWGGSDFIPRLLGEPNPGNEPWAELWMGDHPQAPSRALLSDGSDIPLNELISRDPDSFLDGRGWDSGESDGRRLPYLLKLLSAATPLSLQAHPSLEQAQRGFEREEASGLPSSSPERFYRDRNHKPELIVALEPFRAMCGFRSPDRIAELFAALGKGAGADPDGLLSSLCLRACELLGAGEDPLRGFYLWLGRLPPSEARAAALEAASLAPRLAAAGDALAWERLQRLASFYPGDPGVFAALYLNQVSLERLEGFFVPSGILHSYLDGTGVELMASSDNVLRGGLSQKKVDMGALIEILGFEPYAPALLKPAPAEDGWSGYGSLCPDFSLSCATGAAEGRGSRPEILFCVQGNFRLLGEKSAWIALERGASIFVPAASGPYRLEGSGLLFRAAPGDLPG